MIDKPLISVIVPVYMIDRYVGLCVESILNQTYKNLEIILVDDGGKDRCPEICDLYKSKDGRIKVIHKPNGGLVSARKGGLQQSNGAYVSYIDGDDWVGPGFIEGLYTAAETSNADMVCAGFTRSLFDKDAMFTDTVGIGIYEGEGLKKLWRRMASNPPFFRSGITAFTWCKLFKREIILEVQGLVDNRISIGEDGAVTYPALLQCDRVAVVDNVAYHYRQREDSMLRQKMGYSGEAQQLKYLYDYLIRWAAKTDSELRIREQIVDYVLALALMRSGGRLPHDDYSTFDKAYYGKDVVVFSAGTFGQQLINRFKDTQHCNIVAWIDDDYWEYRRCCLDVDPVESIAGRSYDYVLIASVNETVVENMKARLRDLGVSECKMLTVTIPDDKEELLKNFLDVEAIRTEEEKNRKGVLSHA